MNRAGIRYKTAEERHEERLQMRMTTAELKALDEAAEKLRMTRTAFVREAVKRYIADVMK